MEPLGRLILNAVTFRRWFALAAIMLLGFVLLYVALTTPASFGLRFLLLAIGLLALWLGRTMHRGTQHGIELTDEGLFMTDGTELARLDQIAKVDRSPFALKPTNGFAVVFKDKQPKGWVPGMYWRLGKRLGVGGVTSPGDSKYIADQLALRVAAYQNK